MLEANIDYFKSKPVNIPKITILIDRGYHPGILTAQRRKNLSGYYEKNQI
jgi:hypothetical protein